MTTTESPANDWLSKRQTYRRLMFGAMFGGVAVGLVLRWLDYPVVGEAVYWVGILVFFAIWRGADIELMDERDLELERRASVSALLIIGTLLVVGASASRLATWLTDYTVPPVIGGALYGYVVLFIAFGLSYFWHRARL
jgi:hypothetical protein